jgi:hypothetical protein
MTTFHATLRVLVDGQPYDCCVDVDYTWRQPIPPSITGPGEGPIEVEHCFVTAAWDDDGDAVESREVLAAIAARIDLRDVWAACEAHHAGADEAARERRDEEREIY